MSRRGKTKLVRIALPVLCAGVIQCGMLAAAASAAPAQSAYSQLDWENGCTVLDRAAEDEPGAWAKLVCDGHAGYPVFVSDDGGRMSLDYGFVGDGAWESFASFSRIHDTIEWRLAPANAGARPFATIHRWFVGGDGSEEREVLVVSSVAQPEGGRSCMVGFVDAAANPDANRLARRVADEQARRFRCGTDQPRYHGAASQRAPQPSIAVE